MENKELLYVKLSESREDKMLFNTRFDCEHSHIILVISELAKTVIEASKNEDNEEIGLFEIFSDMYEYIEEKID